GSMALSESQRKSRTSSFGAVVAVLLLVPAGGQGTGISDHYLFYFVDAGGDADAPAANDGAQGDGPNGSGPPQGGGGRGHAVARAQAQNTMAQSGGANLSPACRACLAQNCCVEIAACAGQQECASSMLCVFDCQKQGNKTQCTNNCKASGFATKV